MRQALVQLVADMNGKDASDVVRLVQDAEIRFHAEDGRLHHEGLRIGLPDIDPDLVISSSGSVGLDQTLDLHVELPRLDPLLRKEKGPAKCHITGTISNPKVSVQDASLVIRQPDHQEPLIAVQGVNLNMQVENTASGYVLAVEPVEILKKEKLSAGLAAGLVRLVVPDLARPIGRLLVTCRYPSRRCVFRLALPRSRWPSAWWPQASSGCIRLPSKR